MVFPPSVFRGAPHTRMATLTYPGGSTAAQEVEVISAVVDELPGVTAVRVKEALEAIGALVTNLVLGIRAASARDIARRGAGARRRARGRPQPSRL